MLKNPCPFKHLFSTRDHKFDMQSLVQQIHGNHTLFQLGSGVNSEMPGFREGLQKLVKSKEIKNHFKISF